MRVRTIECVSLELPAFGVEDESDSLCLSLKENFQWRKQMSASYLMIPDSCDQR